MVFPGLSALLQGRIFTHVDTDDFRDIDEVCLGFHTPVRVCTGDSNAPSVPSTEPCKRHVVVACLG